MTPECQSQCHQTLGPRPWSVVVVVGPGQSCARSCSAVRWARFDVYTSSYPIAHTLYLTPYTMKHIPYAQCPMSCSVLLCRRVRLIPLFLWAWSFDDSRPIQPNKPFRVMRDLAYQVVPWVGRQVGGCVPRLLVTYRMVHVFFFPFQSGNNQPTDKRNFKVS